ncbi:MAG: aminotransferase class I/II-fold pyridoxal phosphate-dependent enzyme [Elusimicrobia bacterium]|nr:aminotransferase class I/II-fold pyridoxal phosphate-dependent enzyme [Candidatus Obscuribacterium magneticum]
MDLTFGQAVKTEADKLKETGMDPNLLANALWKKDAAGFNYGIGIILDERGKAMPSSKTLLEYAAKEVGESIAADYRNSNAILEEVKTAVLTWQRVPQSHWKNFKLVLPSDAGTGSIIAALQAALLLTPEATGIGIEELGWPAYKAIAKVNRLAVKEIAQEAVVTEKGLIPLYQVGPMNTNGFVQNRAVVEARAKKAAQEGTAVILDRAYSGFEFAREILSSSYDDLMKKSYELQLAPFIEAGATAFIAVSPTKAFLTFALRPCGFLLVYNPNPAKDKEINATLAMVMRARGSSFEHAITRGFAKAMVKDLPKLEVEHQGALKRLAEVELQWKKLVKGSAIEAAFSDHYAGLFRNLKVKGDAAVHIYNEHLYPVISEGRCRLNATGLPADAALAQKHVSVFASHCGGK